jgi:uncharacterized protein (TIGR02996 family)
MKAVGHELLRAVLAAPDDDAPRLVYADWLSERGDPRGELIQTQCILADPSTLTGHAELKERERVLIARHGEHWLSAMGLDAKAVTLHVVLDRTEALDHRRGEFVFFHRGFVDAAKMRFLTYEKSSLALSREPLRRLVLTQVARADASRLSELRAAPSLTALVFHACALGSSGALALASCPVLRNVWELCLSGCGIDDAGLSALASSRVPEALEVLDLSDNHALYRSGAEALSNAPWLRGLRVLRLNDTGIGDDAVWVLARSRGFRALRRLGLKFCRLENAGICALASSDSLRTLTHLDLRSNSIGEEAVRALVVTRKLPHLERLDLRDCNLSPASRSALLKRYGERVVVDERRLRP